MRLWSLHPSYLDAKGLVALWRETLLAKHVLEGRTKGYRNHPQLMRFKRTANPLHCINQYLSIVFQEAEKRGYHFDGNKVDTRFDETILTVTDGQMKYETEHLLQKLKVRDPKKFDFLNGKPMQPHPMFKIISGQIEPWEIVK